MKKPIVLDLETQKTFDAVGRKNIHLLKVSVVGIYRYDRDVYEVYDETQMHDLENLLKDASQIIGFNIRRFDFPVLQPYFFISVNELPVLDLMETLEGALGFRVGLNSVSQSTLGRGKSGSGLDAVRFFEQGKMEELKKYCLDDVRLTRELYEYGRDHGKIVISSRHESTKREIPVHWGAHETV